MASYPHTLVSDALGGLITFPPFITEDVMNHLRRDFAPAQNDVFVVTYPRSGTTWTEQIVRLLTKQDQKSEKRLTDAVPWLETLPNRTGGLKSYLAGLAADVLADIPERVDLRLFTSHLPYPMFHEISGTNGRCIYVARNPKDVAVSYYFHDCSKHNYEGSWPEHFDLFVKGLVHFGSYFDHVLPWWQASKDNPAILFIKYETMIQDLAAVTREMAAFLDLIADPELIERVVERSRFSAMASDKKTNFSWVPQRGGAPGHYRRGVVGDWRNHFNREQNIVFDALYQGRMVGTGLQFDFGDGLLR